MNTLRTIKYHLENINLIFANLARWSVLLMLTLGLWNILGRYIGVNIGYNLSTNGLIEGQWYLFDITFLFGMGWTLKNQGHVRVDILKGRLNTKQKTQLELLGTVLFLLPFALIVMAISISPAIDSWKILEASPDPNGLPRYLIKTIIPLGFLLLSLQGIAEIIKSLEILKKEKSKKFTGGEFH